MIRPQIPVFRTDSVTRTKTRSMKGSGGTFAQIALGRVRIVCLGIFVPVMLVFFSYLHSNVSLLTTLPILQLNGSSNGTAPLQRCPHGNKDTSYCCGTDPSCCDGEKTFSLQPTLVPIGASSTVTTTATATVTATNTRTPGDGSSGSSSTKVAIGAGVGVPLGVVAMAMLGAGFWWGRRKTDAKYSRRLQDGTGVQLRGDAGHIPHKTQPVGSNPVYEVSGDATKQHVELPTVTTGGG